MRNTEMQQCPPKSFNKLAEFANFHLTNKSIETEKETLKPKFILPKFSMKDPSVKSTFIIPKLGSIPKMDDLKNKIETPHDLSLQKIMALKDLNISKVTKLNDLPSPSTNDHHFVDLSTALRTDDVPILVPNRNPNNPKFEPKFIDCDIPPNLLPTITQDCEIDASHILVRNITKYRTRINSKFGKIICSKFRERNVPYVDHNFNQKHRIEAFTFRTKSPDDVILHHMSSNIQRKIVT